MLRQTSVVGIEETRFFRVKANCRLLIAYRMSQKLSVEKGERIFLSWES
jgi:hypothetical protein